MKLNIWSAAVLSFVLIILATVIFTIAADARGLVELPAIDPSVASLLMAGIGLIFSILLLYGKNR
jgi:hypothetical protein